MGAAQLRDRRVHPALQHGDYAPWNVKVSPEGNWTFLDWKHGELSGIPAWDWFHYLIQSAILVQRQPTAGLVRCLEQFLTSALLEKYAQHTEIVGLERPLLPAYLLYMVTVIKPSEGLLETCALLKALLPCAPGSPH